MMVKKDYQTPKWEFKAFETQDVLTASGDVSYEDGVMIDGAWLWGSSSNQSNFEE